MVHLAQCQRLRVFHNPTHYLFAQIVQAVTIGYEELVSTALKLHKQKLEALEADKKDSANHRIDHQVPLIKDSHHVVDDVQTA